MHQDTIRVIDAVQNNLKHISVEIPKHAITVVTGVSGSGKSSLVLDTIAAQSRRELNETFPSFTQRYLPKHLFLTAFALFQGGTALCGVSSIWVPVLEQWAVKSFLQGPILNY